MKEEVKFTMELDGKEYTFTISGIPNPDTPIAFWCQVIGNVCETFLEVCLVKKLGQEAKEQYKEVVEHIIKQADEKA